MSAFPVEAAPDPWGWLRDDQGEAVVDVSDLDVVAVLYSLGGREDAERLVAALNAGSVRPRTLVTPDNVPDDAAWLWVLTDQCEPAADALGALLARVKADPKADVIGCLAVERRRHGPGALIRYFGQTVSRTGRLRTFAEIGDLYQGQLSLRRVLGAPAAGMLVRASVWRQLDGLLPALPPEVWGVDFGWRANLAGATVVADPAASVVDHLRIDGADERAGGLMLVAAHARRGTRMFTRLRLVWMTLLAALGFVLGKDGSRAHDEIVGLGRWLTKRAPRRALRRAIAALGDTKASDQAVRVLRPGGLAGVRRAVDTVAMRFADWIATFTDQPTAAVTLDDMIGDDYAEQGADQGVRVPIALVGILVSVALAFVAARDTLRDGVLRAPQQFAAPSSAAAMVADYVAPVAGGGPSSPPWQGLAALASFVTVASPEWLVTILVIGCVPLAWLAAYRLCRQLVSSGLLAAIAGGAYALTPVVSGALGQTGFAAALWTVLLPVAGYAVWWWQAGPGRDTWRGAAAVAVWVVVATAAFPLTWPLVVVAAAVRMIWERRGLASVQWLLVLVAPILVFVGPWRDTLLAYPGRLLTGIEPTMGGTHAIGAWRVPFLSLFPDAGPGVWASVIVFGFVWFAATMGALRRRRAGVYLVIAAALAVGGIGLTRMLVWAPPGGWARPSGMEPSILMVGVLLLGAVVGLDGMAADLRGRSMGLRHVGALGITILSLVGLVLGGAWWAWKGDQGLVRGAASALPTYVVDLQNSATPGRTLAIKMSGSNVTWSLLEGEAPRLGQVERGIAFGADRSARELVQSVVSRLIDGSADDQLQGDLRALGVANVWLAGGDKAVQLRIGNTPGLRAGTGHDAWMAWAVPDSAIAVIQTPEGAVRTGSGETIAGGGADRTLVLAVPADSRWVATLDGKPLARSWDDGPGQRFVVGPASGVLDFHLDAGPPYWVWIQAAGLGLLILLALPGGRVRGAAGGPRRVARDDE